MSHQLAIDIMNEVGFYQSKNLPSASLLDKIESLILKWEETK